MADDTDEGRQLDEFGFPIPTEEELAAERAKTDQVLQLNAAAAAAENQLPADMPPSPMLTQLQPPTAPLNLPVSKGRMYMGPTMSPTEEAAFHAMPSGTSINLMPPPAGPPLGPLERLQAADLPGQRTLSIGAAYDPAMERYQAQQAIQSAIQRGIPSSDAIRLYGQGLFPPERGAMTDFQRANALMRQQQLNQQAKAEADRQRRLEQLDRPRLLQQNPVYRKNLNRDSKIQEQLDAIDLTPEPTDAQQEKRRLLLRERNQLRLERERLEQQFAPTTTGAAVTPPVAEGQYKVGARYGTMRYKGGDPSLESSWEKV